MKHLPEIAFLLALASCAPTRVEAPADLPSLSATAQSQRFAALQQALEYDISGSPVVWQAAGDVLGSIAPISTMHSSIDGWCRDYEEVIVDGTRRYRLVGVACRKPGVGWQVLDVRPFTEVGLR